MITKETLMQVVLRQKKDLFLDRRTIRRIILDEILKWQNDNRVIILTGIRRCGKSTLLKQIMNESKNYCYINFEDERLLGFRAEDFEVLNETLIDIYGESKTYFFDEIQNIEKFETFVGRLQDQGKKVIITGSNASLLSKEFGTRLTGRYKSIEVYPFSFAEFLKIKEAEFEKNDWYTIEKKVKILKLLSEYLTHGGLPEYLINQDTDYIRTLFENILYKDIIARYSIRSEKPIKELVNILATNITLPFTYNSLKNSLGLSNAITVKEYIYYLGNSYLFFELMKFSRSIKKQLLSPRKIYLIDSSFHKVCGLNYTLNKGRNLENSVFIELKRRNKEAYYYADKRECDFVVKEQNKIAEAIQVCYSLDETNKKREFAGLISAMDEFGLKEGTLITFEQADKIDLSGKKIKVVPAAFWMIGL